MNYPDINAETIDRWVTGGWEWGVPIDHETYVKARRGEWGVLLTPTVPVPHEWFPEMKGADVLGLASGGGQQMPIFAALGAHCTLLDYSDSQLESDRMVAAREGYAIDIVKADMTLRLPFEDGSFDLIFHPVSNCYVEDVYHVWRECFRVLRQGGVLLAGMDNGITFLFNDDEPLRVANKLPVNPLRMSEEEYAKLAATDNGIQFSHTMEEQVGGQLLAGFVLTDLYEDRDREGALCEYTPAYIATRAVKPAK